MAAPMARVFKIMKIESWNEWDPLEEVIVGISIGAQVPKDDLSLRAINYADKPLNSKILSGSYPEKVIEESSEDLERLSKELQKCGVIVHRPQETDFTKIYSTPDWSSDGYYSYCPRDSILVHGHYVIEAPMPLRSRYYETFAMRSILQKAAIEKTSFLYPPRPLLRDENYDLSDVSKDKLTLLEVEPCFDAANILRAGRDLLYLVSNSANKLGATWLQRALGDEFRVHILENIYSYMHIDSTISLLRPGLALINPARLHDKNLPAILKKWDLLKCPDPVDIGHYPGYPHASDWIGMNLLMVNPKLAIVEERQVPLIKLLEKNGIDVLALPIRHARTLGGAFSLRYTGFKAAWRAGVLLLVLAILALE
jgi:N-dimethylarginine dimethylaminohydrolase